MNNAAWYIKYQDHWSNEQVAVSHSTVVLVIFATNKPKTEETLIEKRWEVYFSGSSSHALKIIASIISLFTFDFNTFHSAVAKTNKVQCL